MHYPTLRRQAIHFLAVTGIGLCAASATAQSIDCQELFLSEVLDGAGKDKVVEVFNPTDDTVSLAAYSIQVFHNGGPSPVITPLQGSIAPKGRFVLAHPLASDTLLSRAQQTSVQYNPNGDDAIALLKNSAVLDVMGEIGVNPGNAGWAVGQGATKNHDLRRNVQVRSGQPNWQVAVGQWEALAATAVGDVSLFEGVCALGSCEGYTVNVTTTLAASYSEGYGAAIPIVVVSSPITNGGDFYVEIDDNSTCPTPRATPNVDHRFLGNVVSLYFEGSTQTTQEFRLSILEDAILEPTEYICLRVICLSSGATIATLNTTIIDNDAVGVQEELAALGISLSPNPASDHLLVSGLKKGQEVQISGLDGRIVLPRQLQVGAEMEMDLDGIASGMYFVSVLHAGRLYTQKFIKY